MLQAVRNVLLVIIPLLGHQFAQHAQPERILSLEHQIVAIVQRDFTRQMLEPFHALHALEALTLMLDFPHACLVLQVITPLLVHQVVFLVVQEIIHNPDHQFAPYVQEDISQIRMHLLLVRFVLEIIQRVDPVIVFRA
jgi:hypothetical protein